MKFVWLDSDPGHDDAIAIFLALHSTNVHLLGVSTVHGNANVACTTKNAARCLLAFGAPAHVRVYPGASKPLLSPARHDAEIHGVDGLGGVKGFPEPDSPDVQALIANNEDGSPVRALDGMAKHIKETWNNGTGSRVTIISTGPTTNIALFISVYPELLEDAVEELVFMGGAVGLGNRSPVAEFNILCDPHAAQIVFDAPLKKTMIPLNVTHTAIFTTHFHALLLAPCDIPSDAAVLPQASSELRHALSTLISYFSDAYRVTFGFTDGPPLHDALTIAYVSCPDLFVYERYRVEVELAGKHTSGETVVDIWRRHSCDDSWGPLGKNCLVAKSVNVNEFFTYFLKCVERCDESSVLNKS